MEHQRGQSVLKVQRWGGVTLEREKWKQLTSAVFVNLADASLGRTFTFRPPTVSLFPKQGGDIANSSIDNPFLI